jgi:hypothetical protein
MSVHDKLSSHKPYLSKTSIFQCKENSNNLKILYLTNSSSSIHSATHIMFKQTEIRQIDTKSKRAINKRNFIHSINFLIDQLDRLNQKHYTKKEKVLK